MKIALAASAALLSVPGLAQGPAERATRTSIARIEHLNPTLHAVIAIDPTAIAEAKALDRRKGGRGPLHGVPILLKDNIEARGPLPTTAGSLALVANVTDRDAPLVARLRAAGAVILGKANLAEWARARSTKRFQGWSAVGGQVRNPYALDRATCGSSSGSGAAVAAGLARMAVRSEEHTSELQSRQYLVCRLLLEKKKK